MPPARQQPVTHLVRTNKNVGIKAPRAPEIVFRLGVPVLGIWANRAKRTPDRWVLPLPATYIIDRNGV
jgi:hypothetical protein